MTTCDLERVEALAYGEVAAQEAALTRDHLRGCGACARELALLEAERQAFAARPAHEDVLHIRRAVERRLDSVGRPLRPWWAPALLVPAVALVVLLLSAPHPSAPTGPCGPSCPDHRTQEIATVEAGFRACLVATPTSGFFDDSCL